MDIIARINSLVWLIAFLCSVSGCKSMGSAFNKLDAADAVRPTDIGSVQVNRWLSPPKSVDISINSRDLYGVYSRALETVEEEVLTRRLKSELENKLTEIKDYDKYEDLIVLRRGNQFWYFPTEMLSLPSVGKIKLIPNDSINTLPFERSLFRKSKGGPVAVLIMGEFAKERGQIRLNENERSLKDLLEGNNVYSESNSQLAVISRFDSETGALNHLILPQPSLNKRFTDSAGNFLQNQVDDGDIIQFTGLEVFLSQFY